LPTTRTTSYSKLLEVEVANAHAEQFGAARAGVEQQHQQGGVAAGVEVLAGADGEQGAKLRLAEHRRAGRGRRAAERQPGR
jgi:hypothetical protein